MPRSIVYLLAAAALIGAGCGGSGSAESSRPDQQAEANTPADFDAAAEGKKLLDSWSEKLVPNLLAQRDRAQAFEAGDTEKVERLEEQVNRHLSEIRRFGSEGRKTYVDHPNSPEAQAVRDAGDAWTEWANRLITDPPAGDFDAAREVADLATKALKQHRDAYKAVGAEIPPEFQT